MAFALGAVLLWSSVATGFKLGLNTLSPAQLLLVGTAISTVFFWCVALIQGDVKLPREDRLLAVRLGLLNPAAYYLVLFEAYDRLPAHIAQPLNYTWAIVLAVLAVPLLRQPLTARLLAGLALSYAGVVILLTQGRWAWPDLDFVGVALALLSTLLWALYWLENARAQGAPVRLMAWSFTFGLVLIALWCGWRDGWPVLSPETLFYGAWVGLIEMGVTFLLWQAALARTAHAGRIAQLIFLSPFLSLALIGAVLGETVHGSAWLGLAVIVIGLVVTNMPGAPSDAR